MNLQQVATDLMSALASKELERLSGELRLAYAAAGGKLRSSSVDALALKRFCVAVGVCNVKDLLDEASGVADSAVVRESLSLHVVETCISKAITCQSLPLGAINTGSISFDSSRRTHGSLNLQGFIVFVALIAQKWRSVRRQAAALPQQRIPYSSSSPFTNVGASDPHPPPPATGDDDDMDDALSLAATISPVQLQQHRYLNQTATSYASDGVELGRTVTLRNNPFGTLGAASSAAGEGASEGELTARKRALVVIEHALRLFTESNLRPYLREVIRLNLTEQHIFNRGENYISNANLKRVLWYYSEGLEMIYARYSVVKAQNGAIKVDEEQQESAAATRPRSFMTQRLFVTFCDEFTLVPNHFSSVDAVAAFDEVYAQEVSELRSRQAMSRRRSLPTSTSGQVIGVSIQGFFELIARLAQLAYISASASRRMSEEGSAQKSSQNIESASMDDSLVETLATKVDHFLSRSLAASFLSVFDRSFPAVAHSDQTGTHSPSAPPPLLVSAEPTLISTTSYNNGSESPTVVRLNGYDFGSLNDGLWVYDSCTGAIRHMQQTSLEGFAENAMASFPIQIKAAVNPELCWDRCVISLLADGDIIAAEDNSTEGSRRRKGVLEMRHVPIAIQASYYHDVRLLAASSVDDLPFATVKKGLVLLRHLHAPAQLYESTRQLIKDAFVAGCSQMAFNHDRLYLHCFEYVLRMYQPCQVGCSNRRPLFEEPFEAPAVGGDLPENDNAGATLLGSSSLQKSVLADAGGSSAADVLYSLFHKMCSRGVDDLTGKGYLTVASFTELLSRVALSHQHVTSEEGLNDAISRLLLPNPDSVEAATALPEGALSTVSPSGKTTAQRIVAGNSIIDSLVTHATNTGSRMNDSLAKLNKSLSADLKKAKAALLELRKQQADSVAAMFQVQSCLELMVIPGAPVNNRDGRVVSPNSPPSGGGDGLPSRFQGAFRDELLRSVRGVLSRMCAAAKILSHEEEAAAATERKKARCIQRRQAATERAAKAKAQVAAKGKREDESTQSTSSPSDEEGELSTTSNDDPDSSTFACQQSATTSAAHFSFSGAIGTKEPSVSDVSVLPNVGKAGDSYQIDYGRLRGDMEALLLDVQSRYNNNFGATLASASSFASNGFARRESFIPLTQRRQGGDTPVHFGATSDGGGNAPSSPRPTPSRDPRLAGAAVSSPSFGPRVAETVTTGQKRVMLPVTSGSPLFRKKTVEEAPSPSTQPPHPDSSALKSLEIELLELKVQSAKEKRALQAEADIFAAKLEEEKEERTVDTTRMLQEIEFRERELESAAARQKEASKKTFELQDRVAHFSKVNAGLSSDLVKANSRVESLLVEIRRLQLLAEDPENRDGLHASHRTSTGSLPRTATTRGVAVLLAHAA